MGEISSFFSSSPPPPCSLPPPPPLPLFLHMCVFEICKSKFPHANWSSLCDYAVSKALVIYAFSLVLHCAYLPSGEFLGGSECVFNVPQLMNYALTVNGGSGPRTDVCAPPVSHPKRFSRLRHSSDVSSVYHPFNFKLNSFSSITL